MALSVQNISLPLCILVKSFRIPTAPAAVDTVRWLTVQGFETSSIGFPSLRLVHKICEMKLLFLFLARQTSRGALAFILITQGYILIFSSNDPRPPHL